MKKQRATAVEEAEEHRLRARVEALNKKEEELRRKEEQLAQKEAREQQAADERARKKQALAEQRGEKERRWAENQQVLFNSQVFILLAFCSCCFFVEAAARAHCGRAAAARVHVAAHSGTARGRGSAPGLYSIVFCLFCSCD